MSDFIIHASKSTDRTCAVSNFQLFMNLTPFFTILFSIKIKNSAVLRQLAHLLDFQ
jgi:hypothetical protein